jgi:hypothetical protein
MVGSTLKDTSLPQSSISISHGFIGANLVQQFLCAKPTLLFKITLTDINHQNELSLFMV